MPGDAQTGDFQIETAPVASAFSGFLDSLRKTRAILVDETLEEIAVAMTAASNDITALGRLLGPRDFNAVSVGERKLPELLVRRQRNCSLLDIAVGAGSVEIVRCLPEFHSAMPTRQTLKQSISAGSSELIKMMRERLPESELQDRVDLLEVAAEFHQHEVLLWLLRDVTDFEFQLLAVFVLERKLADSVEIALANGFRFGGIPHEKSIEMAGECEDRMCASSRGLLLERRLVDGSVGCRLGCPPWDGTL
jgi:hypothetical protein